MPELIVNLDAGDEFLRDRVMNLPENVVVGTHNTEAGLLRRLADYRAINTDDETVLNYFDELELHPEHIGQPSVAFLQFQTLVPFSHHLFIIMSSAVNVLWALTVAAQAFNQRGYFSCQVIKVVHSRD